MRALGKRHYDVQLMGGIVLHRGAIAEMRTGEGKTFVAPAGRLPQRARRARRPRRHRQRLPRQARRAVDRRDLPSARDERRLDPARRRATCSTPTSTPPTSGCATCGRSRGARRTRRTSPTARTTSSASTSCATTSSSTSSCASQRGHFFAIVDEVDNILIDEARTPLIISGNAEESADKYIQFAGLVPRLKAEEDYIVDEKFKQVAITEAGTDKMEGWLGVDNMFADDFSLARHLEQALKAQVLYQRDRDYVVKDGEVDHRRRVHRAPHARPPLVRGPPPGRRGQGGRRDPQRAADAGDRSPSRTTSACTTSSPA